MRETRTGDPPLCRWQENFVSYRSVEKWMIYCDTNASYASVHQHLERGWGKPCVVANGNVAMEGDAGACLAISYEARSKGVSRGCSLKRARQLVQDLVVYESCLPLYELYADLYDRVLEWIVPASMCYRGSCDEVIIEFRPREFPLQSFEALKQKTLAYLEEQSGRRVVLRMSAEQELSLKSMEPLAQTLYTLCYLIRDGVRQLLGLPISIAVAPSISLSKALVDLSKPIWSGGQRRYRTSHAAIAFPSSAEEANAFLRQQDLEDLCGVKVVARRLKEHGLKKVAHVQDHCGLERCLRLTRNKHMGKVLWYACHGRDEVLPGYLAAIRDRK